MNRCLAATLLLIATSTFAANPSPPADTAGELSFKDTKISSASKHSQTYSPNATASSILFDDLTARAEGVGAVAAATATISTTIAGKKPGRVKIDVRADRVVTAGGRCVLQVLDGNEVHKTEYGSTDGPSFLSWTRSARPGEVVQLAIWATCRSRTGENPAGLLQVDSVDMGTLPPAGKKKK